MQSGISELAQFGGNQRKAECPHNAVNEQRFFAASDETTELGARSDFAIIC
jgi:hypothetical protein